MNVALFYGHYSSNIGDVAINSGALEFLRSIIGDDLRLKVFFLNGAGDELGGKSSFSSDSRCEFSTVETSATLALRYLRSPVLFLKDFDLADCDLVLVNGGEHFFSYEANLNWLNLFWRALPVIAASELGKRSAILPSSFGPFEGDASFIFAKRLLHSGVFSACRDFESKDFLADRISLDSPPALLDMAFFLKRPALERQSRAGKRLGIAVRPDGCGLRVGVEKTKLKARQAKDDAFSDSLSYLSTYKVLCDFLNENKKSEVELFIQSNADAAITEALYKALIVEFDPIRVVIKRPASVDEYLDMLAQCDCIYTSRFHAAILGYVSGTPVVAAYFPEHGHKMPGLFKLLERESYCFRFESEIDERYFSDIAKAIDQAILDFPVLDVFIDQLRAKTLRWLEGLLPTSVNKSTPDETATHDYESWWSDVIARSEEKRVETVVSSKNARHKEVLAARDHAYQRLKKREEELMFKLEKLSNTSFLKKKR